MKPEQHAALREAFPAEAIGKLPKGGAKLDYVGHAAVTARLLDVDPEWDWQPFALDVDGLPKYDAKGGLWIHLTVGGITRPGYGDGPDPKQRIGDAIRNAAMRFGVALDLWAKEDIDAVTSEVEGIPVRKTTAKRRPLAVAPEPGFGKPTPPTKPQIANMHRMFTALGIADRQERLDYTSAMVGRVLTSSLEMTKADASRLIDAMSLELGEVVEGGASE